MKKIILILMLLCLKLPICEGKDPPSNMWKLILAEDIQGGYKGLYAISCVYRNRLEKGMTLGCTASRIRKWRLNKFIKEQISYGKTKGIDYEEMAKRVIREVFEENGRDTTFGATHYANLSKCNPSWARKMKVTVKIGKHTFLKEK